MENQLVKFEITGLHGVRDYSIKMENGKVIIVGENGSGKTTVFKIMYHTLACDWDSLRTFSFESVKMYFSNQKTIKIDSELLQSIFAINDIERVAYYVEGRPRNRRMLFDGLINNLIAIKRKTEDKNSEELERLYASSPFPYQYISKVIEEDSVVRLYSITREIEETFDATILYLPTYRRIEEQLKNIFPNMDSDDWNKARKHTRGDRAIELVEFGMGDVEKAVKDYQERLNNFSRAQQNKLTLGYLSEIIGEKYEHVDFEGIKGLTEQQISDILKRIESNILSDQQKNEIRRILSQIKDTLETPSRVREKIVCHYFLKLIDFDKEMSDEEASLLKFVAKCNKYLVSNSLIYDNQDFTCRIYNKVSGEISGSDEIHFQDMSSGEKQIVSLFSHLNLTQQKKLFVFIDEPELSLSVDWQRMFLVDILDSTSCIGIVATTHSPFVFENELEKYVHGINEFCTRG
ncbi:MAG: ATP-binding cassette domain-containing protein [Ruminococcaceae bacterium]|nr:ATP-binding cassette domain-containing protein [Oscillospiraceae bacterium]